MKFLVDAHLPRKLAIQLKDAGYDTRHTLGLPQANRTTDQFMLKDETFASYAERSVTASLAVSAMMG